MWKKAKRFSVLWPSDRAMDIDTTWPSFIHSLVPCYEEHSFTPQRPGWKSLPCTRRGTVLQCPLISLFCTVKKRTHSNTDFRALVHLERKSKTSDTLYRLLMALCMVTSRALESFIYSHLTFASIHLHLLHAKSINTGSYFSHNNFIPQWLIFTVVYLSGSSKSLSGY